MLRQSENVLLLLQVCISCNFIFVIPNFSLICSNEELDRSNFNSFASTNDQASAFHYKKIITKITIRICTVYRTALDCENEALNGGAEMTELTGDTSAVGVLIESSRQRHGSGDSGRERESDSERKMFHKKFVLAMKLGES